MNSSPNWQLGAWDDAGVCGLALQCQAAASPSGWRGRGLPRLNPTAVIHGATGTVRNRRGRRPSCGWSASRAEAHRSATRPGVLPSAPAPPPPSSAGSCSRLQEGGGRASPSLFSPSSRSLAANFSPTRGSELPWQLRGPQTTSGGEPGCPHYSILSLRSAPERTGPCPGLGTEAILRRDGWALGFWVR